MTQEIDLKHNYTALKTKGGLAQYEQGVPNVMAK